MVLNHLKLYCAYLEEQKFFYNKKFKFALVKETEKSITLKFGQSLLTFTENRLQNAYYHFAFNIPYDMVDKARKWVGKRVELMRHEGLEILEYESWNARSIYFLDPAGNVVEFIGRKDLVVDADVDPTGSFDEGKILHISEVGVPVFQVSSAYDMIHKQTGIEKFDCKDTNFCACGNDRGLFILVDKAEKTWFPGDARAKGYPLSIDFIHNEKKYSMVAESGDLRVALQEEEESKMKKDEE